MDQHFLLAGNQPPTDLPSEPQPRSISGEAGPWPLPFYPVLGECSGHRRGDGDDDDGQLLSGPCWRLSWSTYPQNTRLFNEAQSPSEPRPALPTRGLGTGTPTTPRSPAGAREPAKETTFVVLPLELLRHAAGGPRDTETCFLARLSGRGRAPGPAARSGRRRRLFATCLQWVRRAICALRFWAAVCSARRDLLGS